MHFYPKISSPYKRTDPKSKAVNTEVYVDETAKLLSNIEYYATEKVDGTNLNIIYDGDKVSYEGHTDKTDWNPEVAKWIEDKFVNNESFNQMCEQKFGTKTIYFSGELIGPKIQSNLYKLDDYKFVCFDISELRGDNRIWYSRGALEGICTDFGMQFSPAVYINGAKWLDTLCTSKTVIQFCDKVVEQNDEFYLCKRSLGFWTSVFTDNERSGTPILSCINPDKEIEGFVVRPVVELKTNSGERVIYKIKVKDILGRAPINSVGGK